MSAKTKVRAYGERIRREETDPEVARFLRLAAAKRRQAIDRLVQKDGDVQCTGAERVLSLTDAEARAWKGGAL